MRKFLKEYPLLVAIVICAFILRLVAGYVQSFSNDELSALYRLQFSNFSDLVHWGIKVDGHPALVHLFLYGYVPLLPKNELLIRLPFIIASTLSLVYFFRGFSQWIGNFAAYMVVIVLAFSGFSIQLGYFARPYAFGILFISMVFYSWVQIFIKNKTGGKFFLLFTCASILACYSHYFALLQVAVFGLVSVIVFKPKDKLRMFLMGLVILIAFAPHYFITRYQLSVGGIGQWLGAPKPYFIIDVAMEFFDRSAIFVALILGIPTWIIIQQSVKPDLKPTLVLFLLSVIPFIILYKYSVGINPLLQYSACFFLFPFLLAFFFSLFGNIELHNTRIKASFVLLLILLFFHEVFIFRVFSRIHFAEFKKTGEYIEEYAGSNVTTVVAVNNPFYIEYYLPTKRPDLYITDMGPNLHFLREFVDTCKTHEFIYAFSNQNSNPEVLNIIADKFPFRNHVEYYMNSEVHHFSKSTDRGSVPSDSRLTYGYDPSPGKFISINNAESENWNKPFTVDSTEEFAATFEINLDELDVKPNESIIARAEFQNYPDCDVDLVISLENNSRIFWRSRKSSLQYSKFPNRRLTIAESFHSADLELEHARLKVYLWNSQRSNIQVNSFVVQITRGNPFNTGYSQ